MLLPAIIEQDGYMLAVIDKGNLLVKQTNSWREAFYTWQQLVEMQNWIPLYFVSDAGSGFFELVFALSGKQVLLTNNQTEIFKKAYNLNYSNYSSIFLINPDSNFESSTSFSSSFSELNNSQVTKTFEIQDNKNNSLEQLREKLIKLSTPCKILTSSMILEVPEVLDLPIDEYETLCQMLTMSGILLFDSEEELRKWQEQNSNKTQLKKKTGKCFKKVFEKAACLDKTQQILIQELMKMPRLPRSGVRYYQEKAEKNDPEAIGKLFYHYSGPAIRSAVLFYETNLYSNLDLSDLIQEALTMVFHSIVEMRSIGRKQFQTSLSLRLYHGFNRISIANLPIRLPAHVFEKIRGVLDFFLVRNHKTMTNEQIGGISKTLRLDEELVAKIFSSFLIPESVEDLKMAELENNMGNEFLFSELDLDKKLLKFAIDRVLSTLKVKEREIIGKRFGLDSSLLLKGKNYPATLEEISLDYGVTRERIRQIEQKALRKLRHSSRSKRLKDFYLFC